ncbi:MAG: hypothetical protein D6711_04195, partial [Chloroflexi bacterium]
MIVLDDVWDLQHIRPFTQMPMERSRILITTRDREIATKLKAEEIVVSKLSSKQGLELLQNWSDITNVTPDLKEINRVLDGHPLAIKIVGSRLKQGITPTEWLSSYDSITNIKEGRRAELRDDNLSVCFDLSLDSLPDDDRNLYHALGVFPEDIWVPQTIVSTLWRALDNNLTDSDCLDMLIDLENLALLELQKDGDERVVSMHDLLHSYNRHKLGQNYQPTQNRLLEALGDPYHLPHPYAYRQYAYHLQQADRLAELIPLMTDLNFLKAKLHATDPAAFQQDCDAILNALPTDQSHPVIALMRSFWRVSAHVLSQPNHHNQLYNQLLGRLGLHQQNHPDIHTLLEHTRAEAEADPTPQLILTQPTLDPAGGMLQSILKGHSSDIRGAIQLQNGNILSWSEDNTLRIWNPDGNPIASLLGHSFSVNGAIQFQNGNILSWSKDATLRIWNPDGNPIASLLGHSDSVWGAIQLQNGNILSWSDDHTLRIWNPDG